MEPPPTARLIRSTLLIALLVILLIGCAASAEPVVVPREELVATWTAPIPTDGPWKGSDSPSTWRPNDAVTAEFHRRAAELGAPDARDCGVGRRWVFSFKTDRAAADACVADALATGTPFRVQYAYFDIDTSRNKFLFTGKDDKLYFLDASVSLDQTWQVRDPEVCLVPFRDPDTFMIGCTFKED